MSTDIHFVKNNPFILNDYRNNSNLNSRIPTSASSIHIPSNFYRSQTNVSQTAKGSPVTQSASCSNIQRTIVSSRFETPSSQAAAAPPVPHSVFRRFRLVSEETEESSQAFQKRQNYNTMQSASISSISATAAANSENEWFNRGRLEHSQSHGAISHFQQPLKLQVDEYNNNNNGDKDENNGKNYIEYGPGIVQKLREKFSKMASNVIENAQISPHAKQKKFASVDDILSEEEQQKAERKRQDFNDQSLAEPLKPYYYFHHDNKPMAELPTSPPLPSRSQSQPPPKSPPLPATTVNEKPQVPPDSPRVVVEKASIGPISALRAKFEHQARSHAFGTSRKNFGSRSQSVNTLKQYEARREALPKSSENHSYRNEEREEEVQYVPKIPEKRPTGFLPAAIPYHQEEHAVRNHPDKHDSNYFGAPKPVRVMDLISPPADPTPKEYHIQSGRNPTELPPTVHSPASSTASSDRTPPPEEPRLSVPEEQGYEDTLSTNKEETFEQYRTQAIQDDRSNERLAFAAIQRQKMTLTLPIGSSLHSRSLPSNEVKIGKPGSTPITGPSKLKLPSDNSGISEVQKLLNKFSAIREQKMQETPTPPEEEKTLPTAIVPPVIQPKPNFNFSSNAYQSENKWKSSDNSYQDLSQSNWKPQESSQWSTDEKKQQNIVSISIGEQQQFKPSHFDYSHLETDDTSTSPKQRQAPPPPLPPRGGTDQQQQQRTSLTSRWFESKQDSEDEGTNTEVVEEHQTQRHHFGGHSKPYGDNETIDEQTRRSLETMSVVKEEPEEEVEEIGAVRLLSRRTLEDDNGTVHRSDFLKSNYPYDSSESEEDDHPNAHLAAYGIHRLGIYEAPNASDGNPVRHSLLNLVAEEDIPELLQAMAEECHFVFDDCDRTNMPTTSGIIHTPAKRIERRKQRNVDRICFEEKPPQVFAYVDESTAYEESDWSEGFEISYEEYKSIVENAAQETAQQHMDLANWRALMEQKFCIQDEQIRALTEHQDNIENQASSSTATSPSAPNPQKDEELGVTSTFSYTSNPTPLLTQCAQPLNLRQTTNDRETSAM